MDRIYDWPYIVVLFTRTIMKKIGAAKFKEQCLAILDRLEPDGLVITKHGKPVATLLPYGRTSAALIGCLHGKLEIDGDVLATGVTWDAVAEP
jgi:antitoxin (DNA-binding transcriptional repressor) of toxin-antitoxin stability system